jgi:membrane protein YqaA with SNARE-associated domain
MLPFSSEAMLAGLLALRPDEALPLLLVATAGNTAGAVVNWALGRFAAHWRDRRWFPVSTLALERASRWFARWGVWSLLLSWLPVIGDPLTLAAGVLRVDFLRFLLLVAIGKAARYAAVAGGVLALNA